MRKIEALQILQNNSPKATTKSNKKLSSDKDNFEFKSALDSKVKEQDYANQNNASKDVQSKDKTQIIDESSSKKPENEDLGDAETEPKDDKFEIGNILNQAVFSANVLDLGIRPKVRNINLETVESTTESIENVPLVSGANLEETKADISKIAKINLETTDENISDSQILRPNSDLEMTKAVEPKEIKPSLEKQEITTDKIKALGEDGNHGIKDIEKDDKFDQFSFEKNDESGDDISVDIINSAKSEKTESVETIKIKVGDGQEVSSENLIKEISKNIVIKADKSNEYELQLDPENLGKIKVKLLFEDGKLTVSMLCSNSKTANLLSEGISSLGQAIQQNTKSEVTVNVREENYLNNNQNQQNGQNSSNQQNQNQRNRGEETEFADQVKLGLWEVENLKRQFSSEFKFV